MTALYFQNEFNLLKQTQAKSRDKSVYYSKDFKTVKEVPEHRLQFRNTKSDDANDKENTQMKAQAKEREVMMAPNNLEFFYAAEETSQRIWRIDAFLNSIYKWLVRSVLLVSAIATVMHIKQKKDMRSAATAVSTRIEKEGVQVILDKDGAVVIKMDGKIQQVLPIAEYRTESKEGQKPPQDLMNRHIAK